MFFVGGDTRLFKNNTSHVTSNVLSQLFPEVYM